MYTPNSRASKYINQKLIEVEDLGQNHNYSQTNQEKRKDTNSQYWKKRNDIIKDITDIKRIERVYYE